MRRIFVVSLCIGLFAVGYNASAQTKEITRVEKSTTVLKDFADMEESIPQQLLEMSEGMIIVPAMINAGFVLAGKRGRGIAIVKNADGSWSDPLFVTITGGSVGFQAGIQAVDLVLIFRQRETLLNIEDGTFTLGGDISATAGPLGRSSSATTDFKFEAEVYSYSRSKGLFAGISLSGSAITVDPAANRAFYGADISPEEVFSGSTSGSQAVSILKDELRALTASD